MRLFRTVGVTVPERCWRAQRIGPAAAQFPTTPRKNSSETWCRAREKTLRTLDATLRQICGLSPRGCRRCRTCATSETPEGRSVTFGVQGSGLFFPFFSFFQISFFYLVPLFLNKISCLHSGKSKVTRVTVPRDVEQPKLSSL